MVRIEVALNSFCIQVEHHTGKEQFNIKLKENQHNFHLSPNRTMVLSFSWVGRTQETVSSEETTLGKNHTLLRQDEILLYQQHFFLSCYYLLF